MYDAIVYINVLSSIITCHYYQMQIIMIATIISYSLQLYNTFVNENQDTLRAREKRNLINWNSINPKAFDCYLSLFILFPTAIKKYWKMKK